MYCILSLIILAPYGSGFGAGQGGKLGNSGDVKAVESKTLYLDFCYEMGSP